MASCKYCGTEITWMKEGRKNIPVQTDGVIHTCENYQKARNSYREINPNEIDPELKKLYESRINKKK